VVATRLAANEVLLFEARLTAIDDFKRIVRSFRYRTGPDGDERAVECDFVAGSGASSAKPVNGPLVTSQRADGQAPSHSLSAHSPAAAANPIRWFI
jgi:hypothetical protein